MTGAGQGFPARLRAAAGEAVLDQEGLVLCLPWPESASGRGVTATGGRRPLVVVTGSARGSRGRRRHVAATG